MPEKGLPFCAMATAKKKTSLKSGAKSGAKSGKGAAKKPAPKVTKKPAPKIAKKPVKKSAPKIKAKESKQAKPGSKSSKSTKAGEAGVKGRPFPKKSAPAAEVAKASAKTAPPPKTSNAPVKSGSSSSAAHSANDGFQRRLLLPPPPKLERKSKHVLKPLREIPNPLVVAGGENPWSKDELKEMKVRLTKDLATYKAELAAAEAQAAELLQDSSDGAGDDQADAGTKTFEREHELSLVYNAQDLVLQTELALARIASGTYTTCELCGNPIGKARLQVFPRATLCMICKQKEERR